jgi:nicotinate-nucleotide adenylyltransferase
MSTLKNISSKSERIVIFGGAFDPFHNGHVAVIRQLLKLSNIGLIVVVPSGARPDKLKTSSAQARLEISRLGVGEIFKDEPRVIVSDLQVNGAVGFSSIDLLRHFKALYPEAHISTVIGSELIKDLPNWHKADELKQEANFIVVSRPGEDKDSLKSLSANYSCWNLEPLPDMGTLGVKVSSTELRARLAKGDLCNDLLPESVARYCLANNLYRLTTGLTNGARSF